MQLDQAKGGAEFACLIKNMMLSRGRMADAIMYAQETRAPARVQDVLKAAVNVGTLANPTYAGALASYRTISDGFLESLINQSAFDRMLDGGMQRWPLRTNVGQVVTYAEASEVGEGQLTPVTQMALSGGAQLDERKAVAIVALSNELLKVGVRGTEALITRELRKAVARATNSVFLTGITASSPSFASSGSAPVNVLADFETLLESIGPTATSRLYAITDGATASRLATKPTTDGTQAFPGMTPLGGELAGVPVLVADDVPADTAGSSIVLVDATAIAGESDVVTVDVSTQAMLEINDAPTGTANSIMTSLFQQNLTAIKALRWFGFEVIRGSGVAIMRGVNY